LPLSARLPRRPTRTVQHPDVGRLAEFLDGALADLADALAGDAQGLADLLEGEGFGACREAVVEREDLAFPGGEVPGKETVDELAAEEGVGLFLDVGAAGAGEIGRAHV